MHFTEMIESTIVQGKGGMGRKRDRHWLWSYCEQRRHKPSLRFKMPGGRNKNMKKRQQEEDNSKNLTRFLSNQGISAGLSEHVARQWPGGEPFTSPEKETGARARECCVCKARSPNTKKCSGCYSAWFCSVDCQRKAWPDHRGQCKVVTITLTKCSLFPIFSSLRKVWTRETISASKCQNSAPCNNDL